ncbi:MAG: phosphoribosylformylglycinamidine synthase subunit PurL [Pseudomonadota bacterium]
MSDHQPITDQQAYACGLSQDELSRMLAIVGRLPNRTELGIFAAMWSEHCSYKSSRHWLKRLPSKGKSVLIGPGENAGAVDIGGGYAAVFKMESHNHPSFIEPRQGAATGVGGILRDVFAMGARPVANLNVLRFGAPDHPDTPRLLAGVVEGIAHYGNSMGVPTVGGETGFHPSYNGNILVNAMSVGIVRKDQIFTSSASGPGNVLVYAGAKTGRDGIHGATMASSELDAHSAEQLPAVQVGDPFRQKLLMEACLELVASDDVVAVQDMGAAGLTSSSIEMADKGGVGVQLWLDRVPQRESGMTPYEIMLSESQERMLLVVPKDRIAKIRTVFQRWLLDCTEIGQICEGGRLQLFWHGEPCADLPIKGLVAESPLYIRDAKPRPANVWVEPIRKLARLDPLDVLKGLLSSHYGASRRWIWRQYDYLVQGGTIKGPGGDAAIIRIRENGARLALTSDSSPRYVAADPVEGGKQVVAEAWRNLSAVGATPLAFTDNLNFASPEDAFVMGDFTGCIEGMAIAAEMLDFPVVSGNVSFYNENPESAIQPTPVIGGVGLLNPGARFADLALKGEGHDLILVGVTHGHLGASWLQSFALGIEDGPPPPIDLDVERRNGDYIRAMIGLGLVHSVHDVSDGGVLMAICEMALAGDIGCKLDLRSWLETSKLGVIKALFGEDQGRYMVACDKDSLGAFHRLAEQSAIRLCKLGTTGGDHLVIDGIAQIALSSLREHSEAWLPDLMMAKRG